VKVPALVNVDQLIMVPVLAFTKTPPALLVMVAPALLMMRAPALLFNVALLVMIP
jgi:hypothetical protein